MSKDKGVKNQKKAPADKSGGKIKAVSSYKSESKSGQTAPIIPAFAPKPDAKSGGKSKA